MAQKLVEKSMIVAVDVEGSPVERDVLVTELAQIVGWEQEKNVDRLLLCAIVEGGVLERNACDALRRLGKPAREACMRTIMDEAAEPFHRFSAARVLGVIGDSGSCEQLCGLLSHAQLCVRRGAAEGLGYHKDKKAVEPLLALLDDPDAPLRRSVAFALMKIGDKKAAPRLVPLLGDRNASVRRAVAVAIGKLDGAKHVSSLIEHLDDPDRSVRRALVCALEGLEAAAATEPLLRLSRDGAPDVRHAATKALAGYIGEERVVDRLIEMLADPCDPVKRAAVEVLTRNRVTRAARALADLLRDGPDRLSQIKAALALGELGDKAAVGRLAQALLIEDFSLQDAASRALTQILGEVDIEALRAEANVEVERWDRVLAFGPLAMAPLIRTVQSGDRTVQGTKMRATAARALGTLGQLGHREVIPPLLELLDETIPTVRSAAAEALATVGDRSVAGKLAPLLGDLNPELRAAAIKAVGTLGEPGSAPGLLELALHDPEKELRKAAVVALGKLGPAALPGLRELIGGGQDEESRLLATESLNGLGTIQAVDLLIQALGDANSRVRLTALQGLERYGWRPVGLRTRRLDAGFSRWSTRSEWTTSTEPVPQVQVMIEGLKAEDPVLCRAAAEVLGDLGDPQAIEPLTRLLDAQDVDVAIVAAQSLVRLGVTPTEEDRWLPYRVALHDEPRVLAAGAKAVPALRSELGHPDPEQRSDAVRLLGAIGTPEAVPPLFACLTDRYPEVMEGALAALDRCGADTVRAAYRKARKKEEKEAALQGLLPLAVDPRPAVRRWAFIALCAIDHPDVVGLCDLALNDTEAPVLVEAIRALGQRKRVELLDRLLALLVSSGQDDVRLALMDALAMLGDRRAVELLARFFLYPNEKLREAAAAALKKLLGDEFDPVQLTALARLQQEQWDALVALGPPSLEPLARVLQAQEMSAYGTALRYHAAIAAGRIGGAQAKELLLAALDDPQPKVRQGVVIGLGELGDLAAVPALRLRLTDRDERVREAAIRSLGKLHASAASDDIGRLYADESEAVRTAVVEVLGTLDAPAILPIVEILESGDGLSKRKAAEALARIGDVSAIRYLESALGDADFHVREAVRKALLALGWMPLAVMGKVTDEKPIRISARDEWLGQTEKLPQKDVLRQALAEGDPVRSRVAAEALAMLGDTESIEPLTRLAGNGDAETRMVACQALVTLGVSPELSPFWAPFWAFSGQWRHCIALGEPAVEPLQIMIGSRHQRVRREAAQALGEIGPPGALASIPRLAALLGDPVPIVRSTAAEALAQLGGPDAAAALDEAFSSEPDPTMRLGFLQCGLRLGRELSAKMLQAALADPAALVRNAAEEHLAAQAAFGG